MIQKLYDYFQTKQLSMPSVTGFVFGSDEQSLREQISRFSSYYMFVDYGSFSSDVDRNNRIVDTLECAVTIAKPLGTNVVSYDDILRVQIETFEMMASLRAEMLRGQRESVLLQNLSPKHQILPFVAPDICRSIGSTLSFRLEGVDLLFAK